MIEVTLNVSTNSTVFALTVGENENVVLNPSSAVNVVSGEKYVGPYEITPSSQEQTISTDHLFMTGNVVVKAIPNNYGLITYNGGFLLVS